MRSPVNLLVEPLLSISSSGKTTLPGLFAAMACNRVQGFPALRPHQRPAWHMFLVQLAALALHRGSKDEIPEDEVTWTSLLRGLTPNHPDDAPWRLEVYDWRKPAFLQPPVPGALKWSPVETPDELDLLITARNHDLKSSVARDVTPEDWIYALVSLQTCEGLRRQGKLRYRTHERWVVQPPDARPGAGPGGRPVARSVDLVAAGCAAIALRPPNRQRMRTPRDSTPLVRGLAGRPSTGRRRSRSVVHRSVPAGPPGLVGGQAAGAPRSVQKEPHRVLESAGKHRRSLGPRPP